MAFRITFDCEVGSYDARMSRQQVLDWLSSQGLTTMVGTSPPTTAGLEELDEARLGQVLAAATMRMVKELADREALLNIRNEPDDDVASWAAVRATAIGGIRVRIDDGAGDATGEGGQEEEDLEDSRRLPWSEADGKWFEDTLKGFGE